MTDNTSVLLKRRPNGDPVPDDFALETQPLVSPGEGEALLRNHFVSLDAGFRNWMNEGAGDEVLPAMPLDAPVMGLVMGEVIESSHPRHSRGVWTQ